MLRLTPSDGWLIHSLKIGGSDVLLKDGSYTLSKPDGDYDVKATFIEKQTVKGDFSVNYRESQKYGNDWKTGLYDYNNLYITDDNFHALGNDNGIGYVVYKFAPKEDMLTFESAKLVTVAKLNDYVGMMTNERVDYYISYNGTDYELVYKSPINRVAVNEVTTTLNLSEYVFGKNEVYLKIEVGSNSANWTLLYSLNMSFDYQRVELTVDYGDYSDVLYTQYKGKMLDTSLIVPREGYELVSQTVYADAEHTQEFDLTQPIEEDTRIYISAVRTQVTNVITYVLDEGENSPNNPTVYDSSQTTVLSDAVRDGYLFGGWYTDEARTLRITEIVAGRTGEITLYAKWIENTVPLIPVSWEITYVLNGGENSAANFKTYKTGVGVELQAAARIGYVFDGWYTDEAFEHKIEKIDADSKGHITVYAKWVEAGNTEQGEKENKGCGGSVDADFGAIVGASMALIVLVRFALRLGKRRKSL